MIKSLEIHGLRGFGKPATIEFAIPNGELGSGITFAVGANNSGKTTIIEALRAFNCPQNDRLSFSERKRNKKCEEGKVHLKIVTDDDYFTIDTDEKKGSNAMLRRNGNEYEIEKGAPRIFVLQSRRSADYEFYHNELDRKTYMEQLQLNYNNRGIILSDFSSRLFKMYNNKMQFDSILHKALGCDLEWTIEQNENGTFYLKIITGDYEHSSEGLGDGIWNVFTICDALYDSNPSDIIAIDEPELSLHPALQKKVMNLLKEYARDRQIIISTHSPYFVDIKSIVDGAYLYRSIKDGEGDIRVFRISDESRNNLKGFLKDLCNPHALGFEAKEIFFLEDRIILVEGQDDVLMYTLASSQLNIPLKGTFFGWGVGGAEKMPKIIKMLEDLGYSKVSAILDGDKIDLKNELENDYPEYSFFSISKDDVRDKPERNIKAKFGLMTEGGLVKDECKEEMKVLFQDINEAFS